MDWILKLNYEKIFAAILGGFLVPVFEFMYGPGLAVRYTMLTLITFIVLDWISGIRASKKDNSYGSNYGRDGVARTLFMLLLPVGGHFIDIIFSFPSIAFGALAGGLLYHTSQSMTANCIRAQWGNWLPIDILNIITNWVKSELEAKMSRAQQRISNKE